MLSPIIILVEPQLGENIGSACRAMLNFNVNTLRLVNPRDGWPNPAANALSAGALEDKNFNVSLYNSLNEATEDISYLLATSARHRDMNKPVYDTTKAIFHIVESENSGLKTGIMFGGEKSGLNNKDLVKADAIININSNKDFSSINLSMSVLTVCYQWFIEKNKTDITEENNTYKDKEMATKSELTYFIERLVRLLEETNFFNPEERKKIMINHIEAIFRRNNLTLQELNILHGIITTITRV